MADDTDDPHNHDGPATTNQPVNAEPRPRWSGFLAVLVLVVVVAVIFAVVTWTRYHT